MTQQKTPKEKGMDYIHRKDEPNGIIYIDEVEKAIDIALKEQKKQIIKFIDENNEFCDAATLSELRYKLENDQI